jgi:hypothetical protein
VTAYNMVRLWCDAYDRATGRQCTERFEGVADSFKTARRDAAEKGWARVAVSGADADEGDRCPDHKPEPVQVHPVPEEG